MGDNSQGTTPDATGMTAPSTTGTPFDWSSNWMQGAGGALDQMAPYNPNMLSPEFGQGVQPGSVQGGEGANLIRGANPVGGPIGSVEGSQGGRTVAGSGNTIDQYGAYQSPYIQDVVDATMGDMMEMNSRMLNQNQGNAAMAGAYGSGRHGVVDALTNAETMRAMGSQSAALRNQGFNTAMGLAGQHVGQDMARGQSLAGMAGQDIANQMTNDANTFGRQLTQGGQLAGLQGQDIANQFKDWRNRYDVSAGDRAANQQAAQMNNAALLSQAGGYRGLAGDAFDTGRDLLDMQRGEGDAARDATQDFLSEAGRIFDSNDPLQISNAIQTLLSGSPLTGNMSGSTTQKPSLADTIGTVIGGAADLRGAKG